MRQMNKRDDRSFLGVKEGRKNVVVDWSYLIFFALVFIISPLISVVFQIIVLVFSNNNSRILVIGFIVSQSILLGIINSCKVPDSDMVNYLLWYRDVPYTNFFDYAYLHTKEPLYHVLVYALYYLTLGGEKYFIVAYTAIVYVIVFLSVYAIGRVYIKDQRSVVLLISASAMFWPLFSISFQVNRQVFAGALFLSYLWLCYNGSNKSVRRLVLGASFFAHLSAIVFVLVSGLSYVFEKYKVRNRAVLTVITVALLVVLREKVSNIISGAGVISVQQLSKRISQGSYHELGGLPLVAWFLVVGSAMVIIYYNRKTSVQGGVCYQSVGSVVLEFVSINTPSKYSDIFPFVACVKVIL